MTRLPDSWRSALVVGGPLFNVGLVSILMGISFLAVALPDRSDELITAGDAPDALAFSDTVASTTAPPPTRPATTTTVAPSTTTATDDDQINIISSMLDDLVEASKNPDRFAPAPPPSQPEPTEVVKVVYRTEPSDDSPPRPECTDYETRTEAQAAFAADPVALAHFDGDGDGTACEHIPDPTDRSLLVCSDFAEQPDAQAVFDSDPAEYAHFDGDGDGRACEQLPGAPGEPEPVETPPPVPSVDAVRAQTSVYGLHTREAPWWMGEVDYVTRLVGKAPNNLLFFANWSKPFPADEVATAWSRGMTPQVAWEPVIPGADGQPKLADIASGEWDVYIDEWAAAAAAHGQPIVLRFAAEMNGHWYPWSENHFGNGSGEFAPMWRHVHERFELAGADNVIWLWSVNRVDNLRSDITTYWPGAEYVDWVGISGYWRGYQGAPAPTFQAIFGETLAQLRALTAKPILLAETGAGTSVDADRVQFLTTLFQGLAENTDLIGFVYFNDRKAGGDWRMQFSQNMVDAFAAGVAADRWVGGVLPPGMDPGERLGVPAHGDPDVDLGNPDG